MLEKAAFSEASNRFATHLDISVDRKDLVDELVLREQITGAHVVYVGQISKGEAGIPSQGAK